MNILLSTTIFSQPMVAYFAIALLHLFSGLYFAAIRWFHVCVPYRQNPDFYYPARKWLAIFHLFVLVELPYVLNPASDICFLTACVVLAWSYPVAAVTVGYAYFGDQETRKHSSVFLLFVVLVLVCQSLFSLAVLIFPDFLSQYYTYLLVVVATVSFLLYGWLALASWALYKKIRRSCLDSFSDEEKLPTSMAYTGLFSMLTIFVLTSLPFVTQSRAALAVVQVVLIVWHLFFLIFILDSKIVSEEKEEVVLADEEERVPLVSDMETLLLSRVEDLMVKRRLYLKSGFTAAELAVELGTNRTYLTNAIKTKYESFYHLVNSYRLEYAEKYLREHPESKKEQLALAAGFGSYRSYARALKTFNCKNDH